MKLDLDIRVPREAFDVKVSARMNGRAWGLFGPSGAGKTTLLHAIAGLAGPTAGRIALNGRTLLDDARRRRVPVHRRRVGCVFQDSRLWPHLDVRGNLLYGWRLTPRRRRRFEPRRVCDLLELGELLDRRVGRLSGGEKRRVALGRAILGAPDLLLLDEPLAGLDAPRRRRILAFLAEAATGLDLDMIVVSHDLETLLALTERLLVLRRGRAVACGRYMDVLAAVHGREGAAAASNVLTLGVRGLCDGGGVTLLEPLGGPVRGPALRGPAWAGCSPGTVVRAAIPADDVALAAAPVENISVQNQLRGQLKRILPSPGGRLCVIDAGVRLLSEVTEESAERLGLRVGQPVWCLFKARAVRLLAEGARAQAGEKPPPADPSAFARGAMAKRRGVGLELAAGQGDAEGPGSV